MAHHHTIPVLAGMSAEARARQAGQRGGSRLEALRVIAALIVPKLSGEDFVLVHGALLLLTQAHDDGYAQLALEFEHAALARYPRYKGLGRPANAGDKAMAIEADRDTFQVDAVDLRPINRARDDQRKGKA